MRESMNGEGPDRANDTEPSYQSKQATPQTLPASPSYDKPLRAGYVTQDGLCYPIVDAVLQLPNSLVFHCVGCGKDHFHGARGVGESLKVGDLAGHRVSHCDDLNRWLAGYYLRVVEIRDYYVRIPMPARRRRPKSSTLAVAT
jgi:hypothetical protein